MLRLPWEPRDVWRGQGEKGQLFQPVRVPVDSLTARDTDIPDGTVLYYRAISPSGQQLSTSIAIEPRKLPELRRPRLLVDKSTYTLTVFDSDKFVKRYAIGLGADPTQRKICQDNRTTPEGLYTIINLQPRATFHRAYDLNYPNEVDHIRYRLGQEASRVPPGRDIGGEIQIHGLGSAGNWTFGCVSLDNPELDELFTRSELSVGTEVFLCGTEIRPTDRPWLLSPPEDKVRQLQEVLRNEGLYRGSLDGSLGPETMEALGRYQLAHHLPLTCQLDGATRRRLGWGTGETRESSE